MEFLAAVLKTGEGGMERNLDRAQGLAACVSGQDLWEQDLGSCMVKSAQRKSDIDCVMETVFLREFGKMDQKNFARLCFGFI
jgi:hypothetical protein